MDVCHAISGLRVISSVLRSSLLGLWRAYKGQHANQDLSSERHLWESVQWAPISRHSHKCCMRISAVVEFGACLAGSSRKLGKGSGGGPKHQDLVLSVGIPTLICAWRIPV